MPSGNTPPRPKKEVKIPHQFILRRTLLLLFGILFALLFVLIMVKETGLFTSREPESQSTVDIYAVLTFEFTPTKNSHISTAYAQLTQRAKQLTTTPTHTPDPSSFSQSATFTTCDKPQKWIVYTIRDGDTLYSLAVDTNLTVVRLMAANCLTTNTLAVGQEIFLPYHPVTPTSTNNTSPTPTSGIQIVIPTSTTQPPSGNNPPNATATTPLTATLPPPATIVPTITHTRNPLFRDTPTSSYTP